MRLILGSTVRFPDDGTLWLVERVGHCSATIRCTGGARQIGTRHVEFADGRSIEVPEYAGVNKPGKVLEVSPWSIVEVVS